MYDVRYRTQILYILHQQLGIGCVFLHQALQLLKTKSSIDAKKLLICSLIYLPTIQIIYIIDKYI